MANHQFASATEMVPDGGGSFAATDDTTNIDYSTAETSPTGSLSNYRAAWYKLTAPTQENLIAAFATGSASAVEVAIYLRDRTSGTFSFYSAHQSSGSGQATSGQIYTTPGRDIYVRVSSLSDVGQTYSVSVSNLPPVAASALPVVDQEPVISVTRTIITAPV